MKKHKNTGKENETTKYIENIVPVAEVVTKKPKVKAVEIESIAQMTPSDSHLKAKTDLTAEKIPNESGNFENVATDFSENPDDEEESTKLGPSISGAIENFISKNKNKDLSDK